MKIIGIFLSSLASVTAFSATPSTETTQVTRALVNNPEIVSQLKANNSPNLIDVQISKVKDGVFVYKLLFNRQCECLPSEAMVDILEDLTPTHHDGPIKYKATINIKSGFKN